MRLPWVWPSFTTKAHVAYSRLLKRPISDFARKRKCRLQMASSSLWSWRVLMTTVRIYAQKVSFSRRNPHSTLSTTSTIVFSATPMDTWLRSNDSKIQTGRRLSHKPLFGLNLRSKGAVLFDSFKPLLVCSSYCAFSFLQHVKRSRDLLRTRINTPSPWVISGSTTTLKPPTPMVDHKASQYFQTPLFSAPIFA